MRGGKWLQVVVAVVLAAPVSTACNPGPEVVISLDQQQDVMDLAVAQGHLFMTTGYSPVRVLAVPAEGATSPVVLASVGPESIVSSLVVDGDQVYWASGDYTSKGSTLYRVAADRPEAAAVEHTSIDQPRAESLAVVNGTLDLVGQADPDVGGPYQLWQLDSFDAPPSRLWMTPIGGRYSTLLGDARAVYFVQTTPGFPSTASWVRKDRATEATAPVTLATLTSGGFSSGILHQDTLYYSDTGGLFQVPKAGGTATPVAGLEPGMNVVDLAVDEQAVYVAGTASGVGQVLQVSKQGGDVHVLARNVSPNCLAVDDTYVYWGTAASDGASAAILRVAKLPR
jgi:hypothetical protein